MHSLSQSRRPYRFFLVLFRGNKKVNIKLWVGLEKDLLLKGKPSPLQSALLPCGLFYIKIANILETYTIFTWNIFLPNLLRTVREQMHERKCQLYCIKLNIYSLRHKLLTLLKEHMAMALNKWCAKI